MKERLFLPFDARPNGVVLDARQRLVARFFVPEQANAVVEQMNDMHVNGKNAMPAPETRVPKGFYLALVGWLEAKKSNVGGIRDKERALIVAAEEWVSGST